MFKINWRKGNYEVRTTEPYSGKRPYVELVRWEQDSDGRAFCFTLAYFSYNNEGCSLHFVGDRPFEYMAKLDVSEVWNELWQTQLMLQNNFDEENE